MRRRRDNLRPIPTEKTTLGPPQGKKKDESMEAKEYKYEPVAQTQVDGEPAPAEDTPNPVEHEQFSTDLFGCFEDHETLCIGLLAPCVLHSQNKERLEGQGHFLPACCAFAWLYGFSHIVLRGGCNVASLLSFQNRRK